MKQIWDRVSLKGQVMVFTSLIVLLSILSLSVFVTYHQTKGIKDHLAGKVEVSASHMAYNEIVREALLTGETNQELIDFVELVRKENDLLYIVVMDNDKIRFTHPDREKIGQTFVGTDADRVFQGEKYTSENVGTLGPSMRAFHPVWDEEGNQIGAVSVGIATEKVKEAVLSRQITIIIITVISLTIGLIGSWFLAKRIKKTLHGMEPKEISMVVQERNAMLESVNDGILAIDNEGKVLLANGTARHFLRRSGYQGEFDSTPIDQIWPELKLEATLKATSAVDHELVKKGDVEAIVTKVPIFVKNRCVGALATFRERSYLQDVMKHLVGAENYARSLRSETHEFTNKLHIIQAMVETESYAELKDYIKKLSERYNMKTASAASEVGKLAKDVSIAHYLAKRIGWMEQMGVEVHIQSGTPWPSMNTELIDTWVTIIGNTFDNAWEAMQHKEEKKLTLTLKYVGGVLRYVIEDNGIGFSADDQERMLKSTKKGDHGYGLANIKKKLKPLDGTIDIVSEKNKGTIITVHIPYTERG